MTSGSGDGLGEISGFSLWGARFKAGLAPEADALNRSLPVDRRLWREELEIAVAWSAELGDLAILTADEERRIRDGLARVEERIATGAAEGAADEDIHTLIERLLHDEIGELAGKLRTGRSRNDTAATATRLWTMRAVEELAGDLRLLQSALVERAEATAEIIAPTYTHLQRAQPIRLGHFFLSHFWPLQRDRERLRIVRKSAGRLPLGSGAAVGSGFPVDRERLSERLGFETVTLNSLDAVSDRDFLAELAFAGALLGAHLSRLAEDLIVFSSAEFGFLRFDDAYSTGSSLMPQKRNPDIAELARGQAARLLGDVTTALALLKGTPAGYNKDLQEDKTVLFRVYDTLHALLPAFAGAVRTLRIDREGIARALHPNLLAVDLADALVRSGLPFREAHGAVGRLIAEAEERAISIFEVPTERAAELHPALPDALEGLRAGTPHDIYERSVESRSAIGGTSRRAFQAQLESARTAL